MRVPMRKAELFRQQSKSDDKYLTQRAYDRLRDKVRRLETSLPTLAAEVTRTQEMGDLSENAAYQEAKYQLRRTMGQIEGLKQRLKEAIIIEKPKANDTVQIGSTVLLVVNGVERQYEILGSHESDPMNGRISHLSPIGAALLGHRAGDMIDIRVNGSDIHYQIINIE